MPGVPIAVEVRAGAALPLGDFGRERPGLGAGAGFGDVACEGVDPLGGGGELPLPLRESRRTIGVRPLVGMVGQDHRFYG